MFVSNTGRQPHCVIYNMAAISDAYRPITGFVIYNLIGWAPAADGVSMRMRYLATRSFMADGGYVWFVGWKRYLAYYDE